MQAPNPDPWKALLWAIHHDDAKGIEALHDARVLGALLQNFDPGDEKRRNPLMLAYWWGSLRAANALVVAGADMEWVDAAGESARWYARHFGQGEREERMSGLIVAAVRRLSMDDVIAGANPPPGTKARRKRRAGM